MTERGWWVERLTPAGPGGVALLRLAGPGAEPLLRGRFRPARGRWPSPARPALGTLCDAEGAPLDQVLLTPRGDEEFVIGCHGGPGLVEALLASLRGDAPPAQAVPELEAEALEVLPQARTEWGCRALLLQAEGALRRALERAAAALPGDLEPLAALAAAARLGRALLEPPVVALVGPPNAGKSSLLNALLERERALVADLAGTTRDVLGERVEADGLPLVLLDMAGQRATGDPLEAAGVARARARAERADARLVLLDAGALEPEALALARATPPPCLVALNKRDLLDRAGAAAATARARAAGLPEPCLISARSGAGLPALRAALRELLTGPPRDPAEGLPWSAAQARALDQALALARTGRGAEAAEALRRLTARA